MRQFLSWKMVLLYLMCCSLPALILLPVRSIFPVLAEYLGFNHRLIIVVVFFLESNKEQSVTSPPNSPPSGSRKRKRRSSSGANNNAALPRKRSNINVSNQLMESTNQQAPNLNLSPNISSPSQLHEMATRVLIVTLDWLKRCGPLEQLP